MAEIHRAAPINQFNRLIEVIPYQRYELGSPWNNMRWIGTRLHDFDAENCTCAIHAVMRDFETGGKQRSSPNQIRNNQSDFSGGIGSDDAVEAWRRLGWGTLEMPSSADWGDLMDAARDNRFVQVGVVYSGVAWSWQEQKNGRFDHSLGFSHPGKDGSILRYDSLGRQPKRAPQYAVRTGAEMLSQRIHGTKGRLFATISKRGVLVATAVTYLFGGEPRFRGEYLARHDNLPIRNRPDSDATKVGELDHRGSFKCAQTVVRNGQPLWLGDATGRRWVYAERMWKRD